MKDLDQYTSIIDDFRHQMEAKMRNHGADKGFPERKGVSEEEVSDYLFDYQAALDSKGSERQRYTMAGILIILPVLIASAFPTEQLPFAEDMYNFLLAIGVGIGLFGVYQLLMAVVVKMRTNKVNKAYPKAKAYIDQVKQF